MNTNGFYFKLRTFLTAVLLAVGVVANADVYSGVGGEDIVWTLDTETGVLEISGTGSTSEHSWKEYSEYIKKVIVHDGVKHIADGAFSGCTNLVEAIIGNDVERIGYFAFENCFSLEYVDLGEGIRSFGGYAFSSCKSLRTIELPNGLTTIEGCGFSFSGLRSVTIPSSVTSIDLGIFDYCEDLEQIIIDEANPVYDSRNNCNAVIETLTGLLVEGCNATIIPEGVTSIGNGAFGGCRKLSSVTIPSTVTYIDAYAFFECNAIKSMISLIEPGNLMEVMTCAFDGMDRENCVLYVPVGAKDVYSVTGGWRDFKNIIELGDTIPAGDIDTPEDCEWSFRLTEADGLLGEDISEGAGNQYRFQSSNFVLPAPTTSIRFTVIETVSNLNLDGYSYTAFGEFTILDAEGNSVPYTATTNADHNLLSGFEDGGGLPALNDGDYSTFFHTVWSGDQVPKEYHYVEFAFEEPINEFSLDIVWREHEYGNRLRATLAYLLPGGSSWNAEEPGNETPDTGADEEGENADSIAITTGEAIDLGLSVKWASCNVGATSPEEYGGYYAWGETEEKDLYSWSTYKWCNGTENSMTKYCSNSEYGIVDNKTTLDPEDDVAHVKWGGNWRTPTLAEQQELIDKCTWVWTTLNGVNGYEITGPNGNSIFLPAAGCRNNFEAYFQNTFGYYWSGLLSSDYDNNASLLFLESEYCDWRGGVRCFGESVRPVYGNSGSDTEDDEAANDTPEEPTVSAGEAIDLGLSVKWASVNLGAQSPDEYGDYLQWDGSDLAHSALGGKWFMPTLEEGQELIDKCTWEWCELNGVTGYKVTGPNGNSIFLPAAGWKHSDFSDDVSVGIEGNYWTITPSELYSPGMASYDLQFHDDGRIFMSPHSMAMGFQTVRAVYREDYAGEDVEPLKYIDIYDTDACLAIDSVGTYDIVAYTRIFDATDWEAWYMPFDVPYSSLQEDLDVAYINNIHQYDDDNDGVIDRTEIEAIKMTDGVLKANFPYVVRAKESGLFVWEWENVTIDPQINSYSCSSMYNTYTFFGSYNYIEPGELQGAYMLGADGYMVSSESMQLGAFRFYLSIESKGVTGPSMSANIRLRVRGDEAATGIETVECVESNVIYDLSGRVVTEITEPGIYIVNGKKVAIR